MGRHLPSDSETAGYRIDTAEVAAFVDDLRAFVGLVRHRMTDADALVDHLADTWSGDAATAHDEAHRRWIDGAAQMRGAIDDLGTATDRSRTVFHGVQELHRQMWPS